MVCMVEFDMADPDERRSQADVTLQQERASRHIDVEGGINSLREGCREARRLLTAKR